MKKKIVLIGILLVSHALFFGGGLVTGRTTSATFFAQVLEYANANVALANYVGFRDIVLDIKEDKHGAARCRAEFSATSSLNIAKSCLENSECKEAFESKAREVPEVLGEAPVPIEQRTKCP